MYWYPNKVCSRVLWPWPKSSCNLLLFVVWQDFPGLFCTLSALNLESAKSPSSPGSSLLEMAFRHQNLGSGCLLLLICLLFLGFFCEDCYKIVLKNKIGCKILLPHFI